ncbi:MAG: hypothetical protein ACPGLV_14530 [Bacteroidia bacterium]
MSKLIYTDVFNNQSEILHQESLREILEKHHDYWLEGSGTSSIELGLQSLTFFILKAGIYIEHYPSAKAPIIYSDGKNKVSVFTHYAGGEPTDVPNICLANVNQAMEIFIFFIEYGKLHNKFEWVDIFDYMPDKYDE